MRETRHALSLPETTLTGKDEAPESHDLTFAEGTQVDPELLGQFQKTAREVGLSQGQAQKVADLYAGHVAGLARKFQEAQTVALNDYINTQNAELGARPGFKEDLACARKTLKEFGSEDLADVLRQTALGSHPALFDFMVKVGRALGEPGFKGGPGQSPEPPLHERIWGQG
jgi:hypothetical protein